MNTIKKMWYLYGSLWGPFGCKPNSSKSLKTPFKFRQSDVRSSHISYIIYNMEGMQAFMVNHTISDYRARNLNNKKLCSHFWKWLQNIYFYFCSLFLIRQSIFSKNRPLGRFFLVVAMSVHIWIVELCTCLSPPSS